MHKITLKPQTRYELKNKSEQKHSKIKQRDKLTRVQQSTKN